MNRRALVRNLMLGALVTGVAPLTGAGVDSAGAATSPAALCQSTFGESGPAGGPVVGEGPSGDPMSTTIGWNPVDWPSGLTEIVTCVSVAGRAAPPLTSSVPAPRNDGSLVIGLTLPPGEPGSLVCEQSVLVGAGDAAAHHWTTNPACFKLRAPESPPGSSGPVAGPVTGPPSTARARPPALPAPATPVTATPRPTPASTPPARASFEAARGGSGMAAPHETVPDPLISVGVPSPVWPEPVSPPKAVRPSAATTQAAGAATGATTGAATGAAPTSLARTGLEHHIPLAGAGAFLALGGGSIILGAPRRRRPARLSA